MITPTPPHGSPPPPDSNGSSASAGKRPDPDKLSDEIAELAAHIDAARYRLLVRIRQYAELERWGPGFKSCDHWLSWRIGISLPTAREHVRVARALAKLPLLSAAMERGEISYSRARAITRVASPENEERLVGFALNATAMQLESLVRAWRKVDRLEDEQVRHERRHLTLYADEDGSYVVRGSLDPEVGELLARAMDAARSALYREKDERTRLETSPAQRAADALGLVAEWALGSSVLPEAARPDAEREASEAAAGAAEQSESERQNAVPPAAAGKPDASAETNGAAQGSERLASDQRPDPEADVSAETNGAARESEQRAGDQRSDSGTEVSAETNGAA